MGERRLLKSKIEEDFSFTSNRSEAEEMPVLCLVVVVAFWKKVIMITKIVATQLRMHIL